MSMIKVVPPGSYDFHEQPTQQVKIASSGLRGDALSTFIKRSDHKFADEIRRMHFEPGEIPIHLIAIGCTENYSCNRNGDGFKEATCRNYHDTFVKHARWYHSHVNKDPKKSYGMVKASHFNEDMKRIELLVALNGTKEIAEKNGGLVAEEELEKLANDKELPTSMSCIVAYDICSSCGNKAKNRQEYCLGDREGGHCKYGGLKHHLGQVFEDGHVLHADNPYPKFIDISLVHKPADRIAYVLGKVASANQVIGGAALAEELGLSVPFELMTDNEYVNKSAALAHKLADIEQSLQPSNIDYGFSFKDNDYWHGYNSSPQEALKALSMYKIAMPLDAFIQFVDNTQNNSNFSSVLPGIYTRLTKRSDFLDLLEKNIWMPSKSVPSISTRKWASDHLGYVLDASTAKRNMLKSAIYSLNKPTHQIKTANHDENLENVVVQYALYKLALLQELEKNDKQFDVTCELAVRQNCSV